MPDLIKDIDEILTAFADNNDRDVTAQQLRNYVVSISVFGSKFRNTTGAQMIGTVGEVLTWDGDGVARGVAAGVAEDLEIPVGGAGDYEVVFDGSVNTQAGRTYEVILAINGGPLNTLAWVDGDGNIQSVSGSIVKNLAEGDLVSIFCEASAASSDFFMQTGSNFSLKRLL